MRTWSIEELFVCATSAAAVAVQGLIDAAHTVEQLTRPARRERDGAEQLAEQEAEEECSEPDEQRLADFVRETIGPMPCCGQLFVHAGNCKGADVTPNPTEPSLSDDELVGVRGLLQERYEDGQQPKWINDLIEATIAYASDALHLDPDDVRAAINRTQPPCDHRYCEKQGYGLCFGVRAAMIDFNEDAKTSPVASATSDSGEEVASVIPPDVPSSPRPPWSDLADALVEHKPSAKVEEPDVVAVICEVLEAQLPYSDVRWGRTEAGSYRRFTNKRQWLTHVAPMIAEALEPHRIYVKRGPMGEPVPVELRPDEGRPTSELLVDGANAVDLWLAGRQPPKRWIKGSWEQAAADMRARADTFADVELQK